MPKSSTSCVTSIIKNLRTLTTNIKAGNFGFGFGRRTHNVQNNHNTQCPIQNKTPFVILEEDEEIVELMELS